MARGTIVTRIQKDGTKRYATVIRIDGKQRWKTFGKKKEAEDYLDRNSTDIREGTYRELKRATFAKYLESWKTKNLIPEKLKPATLNSYGSNIAKYLIPEFGQCQMTAIDAETISTFESKLIAGTAGTEPRKKQSPKSTRNIMQLLNRILSDGRLDGYLRVSPMADVKLTKLEKKEARALTKDEIGIILLECQADVELRLAVLLGLLAGLRRNEIFALHWEDVDAAGNVLRVRRNLFWRHGRYQGERAENEPSWLLHAPKTKASVRVVDLSPTLKRELQAFYLKSSEKTGLIFRTSNGGPLDPHNFYDRQFVPALERAMCDKDGNRLPEKERPKFEDVTIHTLRHTFGSIKLEQGENLIYVSKQMGHASPSITANVYAHLLKERRPEAAEKTDAFLFGPAAKKARGKAAAD